MPRNGAWWFQVFPEGIWFEGEEHDAQIGIYNPTDSFGLRDADDLPDISVLPWHVLRPGVVVRVLFLDRALCLPILENAERTAVFLV